MKKVNFALLSCSVFFFFSCLAQPSVISASDPVVQDTYESFFKNIVDRHPSVGSADPLDYYTIVAGDRSLAELILRESEQNEVDPALAFALAFTESRFDARAVNQNSSSVDRGVFQLNSRSFPELSEEDFFNPDINISLGIAYLRFCLDAGENEVTALAMYNAGPNRVKSSRTPMMTLQYVDKVLTYRDELNRGVIPEDILPSDVKFPVMKSLKNVTLLMEQSGKIN